MPCSPGTGDGSLNQLRPAGAKSPVNEGRGSYQRRTPQANIFKLFSYIMEIVGRDTKGISDFGEILMSRFKISV
jgi:hypothetical protein